MNKLLALLVCCLVLNIPVLSQENLDQKSEANPLLSINIGNAKLFDITQAYLVEGRKKERTLRSDYYEATGTLDLAEGSWSIIAAAIGGDDTSFSGTDFPSADIELRASPQNCFSSVYSWDSKAFRIKCPLRSLRFEIRSSSSRTVLLISRLNPRNESLTTTTTSNKVTPTFALSPTIAERDSITKTPSITPMASPSNTPTPSRTPFPTADPESGTYYISGSGGANVRSCASTSCAVVATFQFGKTLSVTRFEDGQSIGGNSRWGKISTGDFIHSSLLRRGSSPATTPPPINLKSMLNSMLDSVVDNVSITSSSRNVLVKTSLLHGDSDSLAEAAIKDIGKTICVLKNNGFSSYKLTYMASHEADTEPYSIKFRSSAGTTSSFGCPVHQLSMENLLERLGPITEFSDVSDWLFGMTSLGW